MSDSPPATLAVALSLLAAMKDLLVPAVATEAKVKDVSIEIDRSRGDEDCDEPHLPQGRALSQMPKRAR